MKKFLSYCGLVDSRISASEKGLPVPSQQLLLQPVTLPYWDQNFTETVTFPI